MWPKAAAPLSQIATNRMAACGSEAEVRNEKSSMAANGQQETFAVEKELPVIDGPSVV